MGAWGIVLVYWVIAQIFTTKEFEEHVNNIYWKEVFGNGSYFIAK
jgi:hypothetical protein